MHPVRPPLWLSVAASVGFGQLALLAALSATVGLGPAGWLAGVAVGLATILGSVRLLRIDGVERSGGGRQVGWANQVTLLRTVLVGGITALIVDGVHPEQLATLLGLCVLALILDAVDGWVARRTATVTPAGARLDMETDAFLILILSVRVSAEFGPWVLAIGLARYVFWIAGRLVPWLDAPLPFRYWRKPVTAVQGIVLTVAVAGFLPAPVTVGLLLVALALLAESFGRDVWWLWRRRDRLAADPPRPRAGLGPGPMSRPVPGSRRVAGVAWSVAAAGLVWSALVTPSAAAQLHPLAFVRVPVEAIVLLAVVLAVPARAGRRLAMIVGAALGVLTVVKLLDLGFTAALDRPFDPLTDWAYLPSAVGVLDDSIGRIGTVAALGAAAALVLALLTVLPAATGRTARIAYRHRRDTVRFIGAGAAIWLLAAGLGLRAVSGPMAAADTTDLAVEQLGQIETGLHDQRTFADAIAHDPMSLRSGAGLLQGLRGKDVLIVFVESYGRVALQDSGCAPAVSDALAHDSAQLAAAGFGVRSGFLTSPTFGGISWLAHATLQSGLWIDSQLRYDEVMASSRMTLAGAFRTAGWRTVGDVAPNFKDWPEGRTFYHYDQVYDGRTVGYRGPEFGYADMPDQYILSAFQRLELGRPQRPPVMAEIDLVSSHTPWAPLPTMVDWSAVGDGSIFGPMPARERTAAEVWRTHDDVVAAYGRSIRYSLSALTSFVTTYGNDNLVLVVLGDHQPATAVSGSGAGRDVPISIIARDPAVLDRVASWHWQPGLEPGPDAPVAPMDSFRDRFLAAFS